MSAATHRVRTTRLRIGQRLVTRRGKLAAVIVNVWRKDRAVLLAEEARCGVRRMVTYADLRREWREAP